MSTAHRIQKAGGTKHSPPHFLNYSVPVSPELWLNNPEYFSRLVPSIHRHSQLFDDAYIQCQIDVLGKESIGNYAGNLNLTTGSLNALGIPYCIPDRIPHVAYMVEISFILDDFIVEDEGQADTEKSRPNALNCEIQPLASTPEAQRCLRRRLDQAAAKAIHKSKEVDESLGDDILQMYYELQENEQSTVGHLSQMTTLEEYLLERHIGVGWPFTEAIVRFGCGITLTKAELALVAPILKPLHQAAILANDYFSWQKEYDFQMRSGQRIDKICNAIIIITREHSVTVEEAKLILKEEALRLETVYFAQRDGFLKRKEDLRLSASVVIWFEIVEAMVSANMLWSITCPRYHPGANQYKSYMESRCKEEQTFSESCLYTGNLLSPGISSSTSLSNDKTGPKAPDIFPALEPLNADVVKCPSDYVQSLPSKKVRDKLIDALSTWYEVPDFLLQVIHSIVKQTHNGSLMIDDIQDNSTLRRGKPATHTIFGEAQTMNSAYLLCMDVLQLAQSLSPSVLSICIEEIRLLHIGQGHDLYWTQNSIVPTEDEYFQMIDAKTSALFRLCSRLLQHQATINTDLNLDQFMTLLGRYFQIRDDYQNLMSNDYTARKGFCSDLDEGKYSLPLIHALQGMDPQLNSILEQRKRKDGLTDDLKRFVLERLKEKGSLEYTRKILGHLEMNLDDALERLEKQTGIKNWVLWMILDKLRDRV